MSPARSLCSTSRDGPWSGCRATGLSNRWAHDPKLRGDGPDHGAFARPARRITFVKEDRKLIGFLLARADGDWRLHCADAALGGRHRPGRGRQGKPQPETSLWEGVRREFTAHDDSTAGIFPGVVRTDDHGRFRVERLVPGQSYSADLYLGLGIGPGGTAFEGVKLAPGEVRDLGDLRLKPPITER